MAMRVLLSAYACEPGYGSEPGVGWNWAVQLAAAEASVWVLTRVEHKQLIESAAEFSRFENLHFIYVEDGSLVRAVERLPWADYWKRVAWQNSAYRVAKRLDKLHRFQIVHHVSYGSLLVGSRLWRLNCPLVFGPVGGVQTAPTGFRRHFHGGWLFECVRSVVARYLYAYVLNARSTVRGAALVLVANRETEEAVRKLGGKNVRFMTTTGLPAEQIRSSERLASRREEPLRILWVARLLPRKGLLLALEAMALVSHDTDWRLTVIGDGPQGPMVNKWIRSLGLGSRVEWRGRVPWAEVQTSYDHADLFLFTSLRDTDGSQLLEAMGRAVPILTLDHHGAATLVPNSAGIKVPVSTAKGTAEDLARAIERLAADRELLHRMSEAAIDVARNHTWNRKAKIALQIYTETVGASLSE